jgi:hypothetical protein
MTMAEAPENGDATQPKSNSRMTARIPASGGRSANGAAICSRSEFLERDFGTRGY